MTKCLEGKRGLVLGVANEHSIAWAISRLCAEQGAEIHFSYQHPLLKKRVEKLAETIGFQDLLHECDVSKEGHVQQLCQNITENGTKKFDFVVHSLAFSDKNELKGPYYNTSRKNFLNAMDISCYSFTEICREMLPFMNDHGSFLTLTYLGSERAFPNYNVMGVAKAALEASVRYLANDMGPEKKIRVNAISAGAIKTLAASAIGDINKFLEFEEHTSPLRTRVSQEDVAGMAMFLVSPYSQNVTGGVHYVDAGFHIVGMGEVES